MSGTITSGRRGLPLQVYRQRLAWLDGATFKRWSKRERARLRQQRRRARIAIRRAETPARTR
jgi:hypothetical protein